MADNQKKEVDWAKIGEIAVAVIPLLIGGIFKAGSK